jgi:MoxR-like ATPase
LTTITASIIFTIPSLALFVVLPLIIPTRILDEANVIVALTLYTVALLVRAVPEALDAVSPAVLDAATAVYEWNFAEQMIAIRTAEAAGGVDRGHLKDELFTEDFLIERPLLQAMRPQPGGAPVLLIDEIDRTDEPFEAFLLEALSDFQVTIPELGTIRAPAPPIVILTSNRTREVHDALKRRCLYHWVDYPDFDREIEILRARAPEAADELSREVVAFVQRLRTEDLFKKPGVAETIDWAKCLLALDVISLSPEVIADTLGAVLKYQDDIARLQGSEAKRLLDEARAGLEHA